MAPSPPTRASPTRLLIAVALALLLFAPMLPMTPRVLAQGGDCNGDGIPEVNCPPPTPPSAGDLWVVQGEGRLHQNGWHGGQVPTYFVTGNLLNVTIPIHNSRAEQPAVPINVWIWLKEGGTPGIARRGICVQLPAITITPGSADRTDNVSWPQMPINDLPPGGYNITYWVNPSSGPSDPSVRPETDSTSDAQGLPHDAHCALAGPNPGGSRTNNDNVSTVEANRVNNVGRIYFVKDQFLDLTVAKRTDDVLGEIPDVQWCTKTGATGGCETDPDWNVTVEKQSRPTWFKVKTENKGTWEDTTDYNCQRPYVDNAGVKTFQEGSAETLFTLRCIWSGAPAAAAGAPVGAWTYDLNVTVRGALTPVDNTSNKSATMDAGRSGSWNISDRAGAYTITVNIDPDGHLRQGDDSFADVTATNLAFDQFDDASPIEVKWRDYTANFTASEFNTTTADPYVYSELFQIEGGFTIKNLGKARSGSLNPALNTNGERPVWYRYYLDNTTQNVFNSNSDGHSNDVFPHACQTEDPTFCTEQHLRIEWTASNLTDHPRYLPPGSHTIIIEVDNKTPDNDGVLELDETNNRIELPIYIQDDAKPVFRGGPKITNDRLHKPLERTTDTLRAGENFTIHVNVTDNDLHNLDVIANVSYNSTIFRHYRLRDVNEGSTGNIPRYFLANISNLTFATNASEENWTVNISATDKFLNQANSSAARIKLQRWPLHTIDPSAIFNDPRNDPQEWALSEARGKKLNFTINVTNETTGFFGNPDLNETQQPNYTANLALNYTTPKNISKRFGPEMWTKNTKCTRIPDPSQPEADRLTNPKFTWRCNTESEFPGSLTIPLYSSFVSDDVEVENDEGGPGVWNFTINITDVSGQVRSFNRTIKVIDAVPTVHDKTLSPVTVTPGQSFNVSVNASDDVEVKAAYVNFTRSTPADGTYVNLTLYNGSTRAIPDCVRGLCYWWNSTFKTGRHNEFGIGGTFSGNVSVRDSTDNWKTEFLGTFTVTDTEPPQVDEASVSPAVQEVGQNVTFTARARDATNVTSYLRVLQGGSLRVFPAISEQHPADSPGVKMTEDASGNFSFSMNLTNEGEYTWYIDVRDSLNRAAGVRSGPLAFRDNLGPRFEMRNPSYVFEGQRYSGPLPRIEALVYDSEGVAASSVTMKVDNVTVSPDLLPAPAGANGFLIVYTVPAAKRYHHNDVVTVNFTAIDNSTRQLGGFADFTFVVDDVAPIVRLVSVDPSYRARPADPLNVSLATRFTLEAEDNDGLPTVADAITVQILGGGNNGEIVYTGPFKINDAPGLYTGPRAYSVQYWATDSVGNRNSTRNITTIFVDETPPTLFQYLPQGRFINATFIDDPVGVSRAVAWYRVNNEPYTPYSLTQDGDQWTTTLPEGKKGDRVSYYLQAWDRINNTATYGNATSPYASFDVGNHEPALKITSPIDGSRVSRTVDLQWNASDEDRDALVFTVSIKAPGSTTYRELTKLENTEVRRYTIDTSKYPGGEYTFRVAVSDGGFSRVSEVRLTIINQASPVGPVTVPSEARPGDRILIKAQITKAQAVVEARLYLRGELVQAYPMNDDGRDGDEVANDGYYSVRVPVDAAGDYRVDIFTRYTEDGELKESSVVDAAAFSAKLTPSYVLSEYAALIAGIALLAAVGIGVAVFVIVRRK